MAEAEHISVIFTDIIKNLSIEKGEEANGREEK